MKTEEQKQRNGNRFSFEQKREVLNTIDDLGMTIKEAALKFHTTPRSIITWQKQHKKIFAKQNGETKNTFYSNNSKKSNNHETSETTETNRHKKPLKDIKTDRNTNGTSETETIIIYRDSETGETLLESNNCAVFEGTWKGEDKPAEVIMDVKRAKINTPDNTKPVEIDEVKPQISLTDKIVTTLKNPLVTTGLIGIGGYAIKRYVDAKGKQAKDKDTNW